MIPLGHVAGVPVEEFIPAVASTGVSLLAAPGLAQPPPAARRAPAPEEMTTLPPLRIERTFDAPAERVFDAWTNEEVMRRWFHAQQAWETPVAEVDLRIGGAVRVVMRDTLEGNDIGGGGHYTEIDPPTRLAFTWTWDDDPIETLIELDFAEAEGVTTVVLTHNALPTEAIRSHDEGWNNCFDNLERALAMAPPS